MPWNGSWEGGKPSRPKAWSEKSPLDSGLCGGESGIRTRGGLLTHTRFPGVRLKPLIHLSEAAHCSRLAGRYTFGFSIAVSGARDMKFRFPIVIIDEDFRSENA